MQHLRPLLRRLVNRIDVDNKRKVSNALQNKEVPNITIHHEGIIAIKKENQECLGPLEKVYKDLSSVTPYFPKSFNLAAYVNTSETLQNLLQLNVDLSKIDKKPHIAENILKLDIEQIKKHIFFLKDYVEPDKIGSFLTKNPMILCEELEDLDVRVNYLKSKSFTRNQINQIISRNPFWLMFSTKRIDNRLGYFQVKFDLSGNEVRLLSTKQPQLITYNLHHVTTNAFAIKEEMGFASDEVKQLILSKPKLLMINQNALLERFKYIHHIINIPHTILLKFPEVLLCRNFKVKQRHLFLKKLGRDQFDTTKENYVPIKALVEDTDVEFCKTYAKCSISDFNTFLKTI